MFKGNFAQSFTPYIYDQIQKEVRKAINQEQRVIKAASAMKSENKEMLDDMCDKEDSQALAMFKTHLIAFVLHHDTDYEAICSVIPSRTHKKIIEASLLLIKKPSEKIDYNYTLEGCRDIISALY